MNRKKYILLIVFLVITNYVWGKPSGWLPLSGEIYNFSSTKMYLTDEQGSYELLKYPQPVLQPKSGKAIFAGAVNYITSSYAPEVVLWYQDQPVGSQIPARDKCAFTVEYYGNSKQAEFTGDIDCGNSPDVQGYITSACDGSDGTHCDVEIVNKSYIL